MGESESWESQQTTWGWVVKGRGKRMGALVSEGGELGSRVGVVLLVEEGCASLVSNVPDWHSAAPALCSSHCAVAACRTLSSHVEHAISKACGVMLVAVTEA